MEIDEFELEINIDQILPVYKDIPKLLYPFNEYYLTFAVANNLERQGIKVILELAIPVSRVRPIKVHGITFPKLGFELKDSFVYPDIFLPEYGFFIEVENFHNPDPIEHLHEYIYLFTEKGYMFYGCALTWKCKKLVDSSDLYFVEPLTGKARIHGIKGKPVKTQIDQNTYPAGKPHTWIQYELFRWLRGLGNLCSVEIDVSESGHVFVPNKITISSTEGIVSWMPERFTKFSGWTTEYTTSSVPKEVPVRVDLCSYDGEEISCFEVKIPDEFTSERKAIRVLQQLYTYMKIGVFDRIWLVGTYDWLKDLWNKAPEIFYGELEKIGLLGYNESRRTFKVIKEAEKLDVKKREFITIEIID